MSLSLSIIPTLNAVRFIEKPPLYYWVVAGAYRLAGGPSALAARSVSVVAGLATLALLLAWGTSAHSRSAGLLSAFMLATSLQFMVSTHWVLLDPLLMLSTTAAAWAAWELLARRDSAPLRLALYLSLAAALWIKGLVGPVLIGVGLLAYVAIDRPAHWRRLHPRRGLAFLGAAVAGLALAIFSQGGRAALWEWAYVNHVQRLLNPPAIVGHRQPLLYYGWTLPYALLPWLPPLIEALRPAHWRRAALPGLPAVPDPARYGALLSAAMLLVLSLSATKRETYLLPLLPPLFLWLGIRSYEWWQHWQLSSERGLGRGWWLQVALLCLFCLLAPFAAWGATKRLSVLVIVALAVAGLSIAALLYVSVEGQRARAGIWALISAFTGSVIILALAGPVLNDMKDMGPFMRELGRRLPPGRPVFATGVDETLLAEVPFYTGREVLALDTRALRASFARAGLPEWVLVQDNHDATTTSLEPEYAVVASRAFGPRRRLTLWRARAAPPSAPALMPPRPSSP